MATCRSTRGEGLANLLSAQTGINIGHNLKHPNVVENLQYFWRKAGGVWTNQSGNATPAYLSTDLVGGFYWTWIGHRFPFCKMRTRYGTPAAYIGNAVWYYLDPKGNLVPFVPRAFNGGDVRNSIWTSPGPINEFFHMDNVAGVEAAIKPPVDWAPQSLVFDGQQLGNAYWLGCAILNLPTNVGTGAEIPICERFDHEQNLVDSIDLWDAAGGGTVQDQIRIETEFGSAGGLIYFRHGNKASASLNRTVRAFFPGGLAGRKNMQTKVAVLTNGTGGVGTRNLRTTYRNRKAG